MSSVLGRDFYDAESLSANATSDPQETLSKDTNFVGFLKMENGASTPVFDVIIEHSVDKINWETLITFTQITADGVETVHVDNTTTHVLRYVRADVTRTTGSGDLTVSLLYDRR